MKSEKAKEKKKENCDISFHFILYIGFEALRCTYICGHIYFYEYGATVA